MSGRSLPENLSRAILVWIILVGRLGVLQPKRLDANPSPNPFAASQLSPAGFLQSSIQLGPKGGVNNTLVCARPPCAKSPMKDESLQTIVFMQLFSFLIFQRWRNANPVCYFNSFQNTKYRRLPERAMVRQVPLFQPSPVPSRLLSCDIHAHAHDQSSLYNQANGYSMQFAELVLAGVRVWISQLISACHGRFARRRGRRRPRTVVKRRLIWYTVLQYDII